MYFYRHNLLVNMHRFRPTQSFPRTRESILSSYKPGTGVTNNAHCINYSATYSFKPRLIISFMISEVPAKMR